MSGSLLRRKATRRLTVRAAVDSGRREHIGSPLDHQVILPREAVDLRDVLGIDRSHGGIETDLDPRLPQHADIGRNGMKASLPAQRSVGLVRGTVQGDIHSQGRVFFEERHPIGVDQGSVGIDGDEQSQPLEPAVDLPKVLSDQGLPSRQKEEHHAGVTGHPPQLQPFPGRPFLLCPHGLMDVAHTAVEIASGRQLEIARKGDAPRGRLRVDVLAPQGLDPAGLFRLFIHIHFSRSSTAEGWSIQS